MKNITFKQFIYAYNFRYYDDTKRDENYKYDTEIIRIHYPVEDFKKDNCWIEFGVYDFADKVTTWTYCCRFLNDEILNSYIEEINYNEEYHNVINVYLTKEKEFFD